ncbi:MAG: methyltransferase domain-containing protein [Actinomycetota bacterium]|nr:methyltransferase domain-containing protein [Actinomycetota bacterium]
MSDAEHRSEEPVSHPFFARMYLRTASKRGLEGEDRYRRTLLAGVRGRVIEVGAGNGLNFLFYPPAVQQVLAVEPEPTLCAAAVESAAGAPVAISVVDGVSGLLPAEDESFDTGVASLVLCSVPDQDRALAELYRVIRAGGELRFYEHVLAERPMWARLQRLADVTIWPRVGRGCHLSRDTAASIERAGFTIESRDRFVFTPGGLIPPLPYILGSARRGA